MTETNAEATQQNVSGLIPVQMKLYASLGAYLPDGSHENIASLNVAPGTSILDLLDSHNVPRESCHLVLLNGIFQAPGTRATTALKADDAVAVWPPVAGG